jgi:hypothetical protein
MSDELNENESTKDTNIIDLSQLDWAKEGERLAADPSLLEDDATRARKNAAIVAAGRMLGA